MALNKTITLNNGCVVSYHRISNIMLDTDDGVSVDVSVCSYVDKEYRNRECPVHRYNYSIVITKEEEVCGQGIRTLLYNKLKEMPDWRDSADC